MQKWKVLKSEIAFDDKWFKVQRDKVEMPNGKVLEDYLFYLHGDFVVIVAFTPQNEVVLERIYRHAAEIIDLEVPSGMVDEGEKFEDAARRELKEETGYETDELEFMGVLYSNPGKVRAKIPCYVAKNVRKVSDQHLDESEDIELVVIPVEEVFKKIDSGEIQNGYMIAAFFMACQKLGIPIPVYEK